MSDCFSSSLCAGIWEQVGIATGDSALWKPISCVGPDGGNYDRLSRLCCQVCRAVGPDPEL